MDSFHLKMVKTILRSTLRWHHALHESWQEAQAVRNIASTHRLKYRQTDTVECLRILTSSLSASPINHAEWTSFSIQYFLPMSSYSASASPDSDGAAMARAQMAANNTAWNLILFQTIVVWSQEVEWRVSSLIRRIYTAYCLLHQYELAIFSSDHSNFIKMFSPRWRHNGMNGPSDNSCMSFSFESRDPIRKKEEGGQSVPCFYSDVCDTNL